MLQIIQVFSVRRATTIFFKFSSMI